MKSKVRGRRKNSGKCNQKNDQQVRFQRACWSYFFYYGKVLSGKNYPSTNVFFWHLASGNVYGFSKLRYKHYPNGKTFSTSNGRQILDLQMDIFCHFYYCHNRTNSLLVRIVWYLMHIQGGQAFFFFFRTLLLLRTVFKSWINSLINRIWAVTNIAWKQHWVSSTTF